MSTITSTIKLTGLHCESCKKISEKRVKKIEGVLEATTDLETGVVSINGTRQIEKDEVQKVLEGTDYQVN
jgi:copper chaperone CopZ